MPAERARIEEVHRDVPFTVPLPFVLREVLALSVADSKSAVPGGGARRPGRGFVVSCSEPPSPTSPRKPKRRHQRFERWAATRRRTAMR